LQASSTEGEGGTPSDFSKNNLSRKIVDLQSPKQNRRPELRLKNRGGAPKGNRNALKHGGYTKEKLEQRRALHKEVRTLCLRVRATVAQAMLLTMGRGPAVTVTRIVTPSPHRPSN
jgi:hypothetical protein